MSTASNSIPPLRRVLLLGSMWMMGLRWTVKLSGLISTMILARLLTPEDFGLVAMAAIVSGLVNVLFEFGTDTALIQRTDATRAHFNAAWSIRLLQAIGAAIIIVISAPFASHYFDDPRVSPILFLVALATLARGFTNIGVVALRKELHFSKFFQYHVVVKVIGVAATIGLAFWLRNYWALVFGIVLTNFLSVVFSYVFHPYRPRLSFEAAGDIWSFSKWMIVLHSMRYISAKFDRLILGGLVTPSAIGIYSLSTELADIPRGQIAGPISQSLVPGFAKLKEQPDRLDAAFLKSLAATVMVAMPACFGMIAVADELVPVVLGQQWYAAIPLLKVLALAAVTHALSTTSANLSVVTGQVRQVAFVNIFKAIAVVIAVYPAFLIGDLAGVAWAKVLVNALGVLAIFLLIVKTRTITMLRLLSQIWRPIVCSVLMLATLLQMQPIWPDDVLITLILKTGAGTGLYCVLLLLLWTLCGKPRGIEKDLVEIILAKVRR